MGASGQISKILTISRFLIIPLFKAMHLQVRLLTTFSRLNAQMTRTHARVWLFGFGWYCVPFRRSNCPKPPIFGPWIGIFQPNVPNIEMFILKNYCIDHNQILHSDRDPKYSLWVVQICPKQIQNGGGRHLEKFYYLGNRLTIFDKIWHADASPTSGP